LIAKKERSMSKIITSAVIAAALAFSTAAPASAKTYTYVGADGRHHTTQSLRIAQRNNARYAPAYQAPAPYRDCGHEGTNGAILGGAGGAVVGSLIGKNTTGTLLGAGVGAVAGHEIAKSKCRRGG
jgi:hypothetical protein